LVIIARLLQRSKSTTEPPRTLIKHVLQKVPKEIAVKLPTMQALTQKILRVRKLSGNANHGQEENTQVKTVEVPPEFKVTQRGERFYYDDSGDEKRVLLFTTKRNISQLEKHRDWYCDGTFDVSPLLFKQIFTIQTCINGKVLPLLYSVLPNKEQATYVKLFVMVKKHIKIRPLSFNCDFELSIWNAIEEVWPGTCINGCYFHLTQNIWKHVQEEKLVTSYRNGSNLNLRTAFKRLKCLAFVPTEDVIEAFELIEEHSPAEFKPVLTYFETYYIGVLKVR
jgi:hypothetical protein